MVADSDDKFGELGVELFWTEVRRPSPRDRAEILEMMSCDERRRNRRIRDANTKNCHLVTRRLVRRTLSKLGDRRPEDWAFDAGEFGRPRLVNPTESIEGLDFNLAHSTERVVMAVTFGSRVGVDLEPVTREVDADLVADKFFHRTEREAIDRLDESRRHRRFLALWVIKEAWMKADGRGIGAGLDEVIVRFETGGRPRLASLPGADAGRWCVGLREVDDHLVAVARSDEAYEPSR